MKEEVQCQNCYRYFSKERSQVRKSPNHFCSRTCAAITNNKKNPKRLWCCNRCGAKDRPSQRAKLCEGCLSETKKMKISAIKERTVGHPKNTFDIIRQDARRDLANVKKTRKVVCEKCGYDKHVEVAHIRAISDFPDDATVEEVNSPNNVKYLCPNCHWEFDNGLVV